MRHSRCTRYMATALLGMSMMAATLPALADDAMARIKKAGVIHVATEPGYKPFEYLEGENVIGYGPALLEEIFKNSAIKIDRSNISFPAAIPGLLSNKYDMIATSLVITPERAKKVAFTRPIAAIDWGFVVQTNCDNLTTINDLMDKRVGAQVNSIPANRLNKIDDELRDHNGKGLRKIITFSNYAEMQLALQTNRIDAFIAPTPMSKLLTDEKPGIFKIAFTDTSGGKMLLSWAVRAHDKDLRNYINNRIEKIKQSGELDRIQSKWLKTSYDTPSDNYLPEGSL